MTEILEGEIDQPAPDMQRLGGPPSGYAADGGLIPGPAMTAGQLIDLLEDGAFSAELHYKLADLAAVMTDINKMTCAKTKGKVVVELDFSLENGQFTVGTKMKLTKPELPRQRSVMWTDEHNRFTRFPPNQGQFFALRNTGGNLPMRNVT